MKQCKVCTDIFIDKFQKGGGINLNYNEVKRNIHIQTHLPYRFLGHNHRNDTQNIVFTTVIVVLFIWNNIQLHCPLTFLLFRGNVGRHLSLLARAADSLCDGDRVDRSIRERQSWNLLPSAVRIRLLLKAYLLFMLLICFPLHLF